MVDVELVRRAIDGDTKALEELYQTTYSATYGLAYQMLRSDEAEDLVQEAYISAFSHLHRLNSPEKFDVWVRQIVSNRCKDYFKKQKPTLFTEMEQDGDFLFQVEDRREAFRPEAMADYGETKRIVQDLLGELPEEQRMCLLMFYGSEMTISEISAALSVPESTVKSRLNYGRKKLQERVTEFEEKNDVRLHGIAPMAIFGFLRWMQTETVVQPTPTMTASVVSSVTSKSAAVAGSGRRGKTVQQAGKAVQRAGKVVQTAGKSTKIFSVLWKAVAGLLCAGTVATGVLAVVKPEVLYPVDFLGLITPEPIQVVQKLEKAVDDWEYAEILECFPPTDVDSWNSKQAAMDEVLSLVGMHADLDKFGGILKKLTGFELDFKIHECLFLDGDYALVRTTCTVSSYVLEEDEVNALDIPLQKIAGEWYIIGELPEGIALPENT